MEEEEEQERCFTHGRLFFDSFNSPPLVCNSSFLYTYLVQPSFLAPSQLGFLETSHISICFSSIFSMGNHTSCVVSNPKQTSIQLLHSDGSMEIISKPILASVIMESLPEHVVCHSDSFYIGQKIPALSPKDELKMGHKYFLLPKQSFQSVLSLVSLASFISPPKMAINSGAVPSNYSLGRPMLKNPFEIEKSSEGGLRIKVCSEFITKLIEDGRFSNKEPTDVCSTTEEGLCNTPQLQKDYAQLVTSRNQVWKPKLDTIQEKEKVSRFKINKSHKGLLLSL